MTEVERAYLAGIIDGEGCVSVQYRRSRRGQRYITPTVQVTNTDLPLIQYLHGHFGGQIYERRDSRPTRKPSWLWTVAGQRALAVVRVVHPYLRVKRQQAEILLAIKRYPVKDRDSLGRLKGRLGPAERAENDQVVADIRRLNRRGRVA